MYKYVLFDMDGTVLDTIDDLRNAVNYTMRHFGLPEIDIYQAKHYTGNASRHLIRCSVPDEIEGPQFEEILAFYLAYYKEHCSVLTRPYDGIEDLMKSLADKGVRMAVVSNKPDEAVKNLADRWFPGLLETSIGERQGIRRKPEPDTVFAAMKEMDALPDESLYVGDTEVDIMTARNAGIKCAAVTWGFREVQEICGLGAEYLVNSCEELKDVILT